MQNPLQTTEEAAETTQYALPPETSLTADEAETQSLSPEAGKLLTEAQRKVRRRRRRFWTAFAVVEVGALFIAGIGSHLHYLISDPTYSPELDVAFMISGLIIQFVALAISLRLQRKPVIFNSEALERLGGVRALPTFIENLVSSRNRKESKDMVRALIVLLPQLKASDTNLLTPRHRAFLNRLLAYELVRPASTPLWWMPAPSELAEAILKAYEQIGDAKAIPIVERLANCTPQNDRQQRIQRAAQECLPLLRATAGELTSAQTLLRASSSSATSTPDTLLRPASTTTTTDTEALLRVPVTETDPSSL